MKKEVRAIILGAGKGTRMHSEKPKVLHEIFSKPLLGWCIEAVQRLRNDVQCIVVTGHKAECVDKYINSNYECVKTVLQKEQLGTGHAVMQAIPLIGNFKGNVIITCGDTPCITTLTLQNLINQHEDTCSDVTVLTAEFENPTGYGRIVRSTNNEVVEIIEEKDADEQTKKIKEVNGGIYCLNWETIKEVFTKLSNNNAQGEYYLTDIIKLAKNNSLKVSGYKISDNNEIYGINSRKNLAEAFNIINKRHLNELMDSGVTIVDTNSIFISPETEIESDTIIFPNTYIEGKNKIAKFCKVGPMARLRGGCEVGEGSKIGNFVELKNAKIAKNTNVCHLSYIGDAELGSNINIGAGTIFANYNSITKEKKKSYLEDGVSIGSNSVLVAPVKIKKDAFIGALSVITKDVDSSSLAITRNSQKEIKNWVKKQKGEI